MIGDIIDKKVDWIESDLISRGMNYERLREDVLDHICCLVEESMTQGLDFDSSYSEVVENIGNSRLQEIEHQTLLLLDLKFQRMKKTTYIIGLISSIIVLFGSLSKSMHWPGAGIELSLGLLAIIFVFLPLYFVVNYREQSEKKSLIFPIIGYFTIALLLAGAIFKIQHWPGSSVVLTAGMAVLIIGFVPLYLVNAFQKAKGEKIGLPYIIMLLVGIGIASLTFNVKMAKDVLEDYRSGAIRNEQSISNVMRQNDILISVIEDSLSGQQYEQVMTIHQRAEGLQIMIADMLEEMLVAVKEPGIGLEDLQKLDKTGVGREVIVDNGWARRFINDSRDYLTMLSEIIDDPVSLAQIEDHLEYTTDVWYNEWGYKEVIYDPVIKIYFKHTDVALGIALSEYVAVDYLLNK